jgi:CBS-domain-containing membrane protein
MAVLGRIDQMMAFKGVSLTIAPLGAVCAVLFTAPASPAAKVCGQQQNLVWILLYFVRQLVA